MYKCNWFKIQELVPKHIYESRGEKAWELFDPLALLTLDALRERYGKMTINDYYWNGGSQWRGLRTPESPYYSQTSQHTFGKAFDITFEDYNAEEVRRDILADINHPDFRFINGLELDVNWLHFDTRNAERIKTFNT